MHTSYEHEFLKISFDYLLLFYLFIKVDRHLNGNVHKTALEFESYEEQISGASRKRPMTIESSFNSNSAAQEAYKKLLRTAWNLVYSFHASLSVQFASEMPERE